MCMYVHTCEQVRFTIRTWLIVAEYNLGVEKPSTNDGVSKSILGNHTNTYAF